MKKGIVFLILLFLGGKGYAADLIVFSGAGLMKPMEEIRRTFETRHDVEVRVQYGNSGELFSQIAAGRNCDVLIPGAEKYTRDALKNGWVIEDTIQKMVYHVPLIAVSQGNPAKITGLEDLARSGVRISLGDPKAPAIGRVAKKILEKNGLWEMVRPNISVYAPTTNQLLIYVAFKQVDAAIIWADQAMWSEGKGKLETISIAKDKNMIMTIPTAVCTRSPHKALALKFNAYVSSPEALEIWKKWGFEPYIPETTGKQTMNDA
jgi:molybdate transport system substrate-binding protein